MQPKYKSRTRVRHLKTGAQGIITSVYNYQGQTTTGYHVTVLWFATSKEIEYAEEHAICAECPIAHEEFEIT